MSQASRVSYVFLLAVLVLTGWLQLGALLLSVLFSYFILTRLDFLKSRGKWLAITLFLALLAALSYALAYFIHETIRALPHIADRAIPAVIQWAADHNVQLPFTDLDSLKEAAFEAARNQASNLGKFADFARGATQHFVYLAVGCVVAIGLFLDPRLEHVREAGAVRHNLCSLCCEEINRRFALFFQSFAMVMDAQITISAINTVLTGLFVTALDLPHAVVAIGATFLCGLVPVVGNLLSNTLVVALGFMVSPAKGLIALAFLVGVHKLEYFLNSKIIGGKTHSSVWLTLLALLLGERLMGITGMILAPVVLHYLRVEASKIPVNPKPE